MSVVLDGTGDFYDRSEAPGGTSTFTVCMWFRWDSDQDVRQHVFSRDDGSQFNQSLLQFEDEGDDDLAVVHAGRDDAGPTNALTVGNWVYAKFTYEGESTPGSSADGVLTGKALEDGDSSFQYTVQLTGRSDNSPDAFAIGARSNGDNPLFGTVAFVKIWSGIVLSDADALTEREYRHIQTNIGDAWAEYTFDSGALTTDTSGNSRTLTENGDPAHSTDEPNAIQGDDPAGGGGLSIPVAMATYRQRRSGLWTP